MFEGPWLFCPGGKHMVRAIAPLADNMHVCVCGKWDSVARDIVPISPNPAPGATWSAPLIQGAPRHGFDAKMLSAHSNMGAVYIKNTSLKVKPLPNDLIFLIPVPDEVHIGGHMLDGTITDATGALNIMPFTSTILRYNHLPASAACTHRRQRVAADRPQCAVMI